MSANSDWKAVMQAMTKQIVFCLLVLGCASAASGQKRNAPNSAKAFVEKKFSTTYEDYREKGDHFQFRHWVGYFNDREKRPVIVWLHGGALMMGITNKPPRRLRELAQSEGYVIVGVHYRNYPFRKVPGIIEDVKQCFAWIRAKGPELFGADPDRMIVAGGSAGGYLTMMCGLVIDPKPAGLVPYWGYGDVDGDWYVKPHYLDRPRVKLEECTRPDGRFDAAKSYLYFRQNGLWTRKVTGFDPATERDQAHALLSGTDGDALLSPNLHDPRNGRQRRTVPAIRRHAGQIEGEQGLEPPGHGTRRGAWVSRTRGTAPQCPSFYQLPFDCRRIRKRIPRSAN